MRIREKKRKSKPRTMNSDELNTTESERIPDSLAVWNIIVIFITSAIIAIVGCAIQHIQ